MDSRQRRVITQEFTLKHCNLSVNHPVKVQLTAASKRNVLRCVHKCFRMMAFSTAAMRTSSAADFDSGSSATLQIISVSA